ncbi:hypothetical protein EJB05_23124, partial [Eragrostis curvula]
MATTETGSHVLEVERPGSFAVGDSITSGEFFVGWHRWRMVCYPCGENKEQAGRAYISLNLQSFCDVKVRYSFALLGHDGEPVRSYKDNEHTFLDADELAYYYDLIKSKDFESHLKKHGSFRIRCDITILEEIDPFATVPLNPAVPQPPDQQPHLGNLLAGGKVGGGDVTFAVAGETFAAHKCILASRSPVFKDQFFGDMEPNVFKALLHFIYTDSLPKIKQDSKKKIQTLRRLIVAADRYGMERLKLICDDALSYHVDASTAVTALQLAEKHGCPRLKHACIKFLRNLLLDSVAL